jgi:hypothetical protein
MRFTIGHLKLAFQVFSVGIRGLVSLKRSVCLSPSFLPLKVLAAEVTQVTNKNTRRASRFSELGSFNHKVVQTLFSCLDEFYKCPVATSYFFLL